MCANLQSFKPQHHDTHTQKFPIGKLWQTHWMELPSNESPGIPTAIVSMVFAKQPLFPGEKSKASASPACEPENCMHPPQYCPVRKRSCEPLVAPKDVVMRSVLGDHFTSRHIDEHVESRATEGTLSSISPKSFATLHMKDHLHCQEQPLRVVNRFGWSDHVPSPRCPWRASDRRLLPAFHTHHPRCSTPRDRSMLNETKRTSPGSKSEGLLLPVAGQRLAVIFTHFHPNLFLNVCGGCWPRTPNGSRKKLARPP